MNSRKFFAIGASTALLAFGVAACGSDDSDSTSGGSDLSGDIAGAGSSAQDAAQQAWIAGFQTDNSGVNIAYDRPRQSLLKHGVRPGTILFEGQAYANDTISGTARVFNRVCGVATYPVSGNIHPGRIVMHGQAPVRDTSTCAIKRYRDDTLVFDLMP